MAKWTLSDYLYQIRRRLDEQDEELYSNDELTAYLNEAMQLMALDLQLEDMTTLQIKDREELDFREVFIDSANAAIEELEQRDHQFCQIRSLYVGGERQELLTPEQALKGLQGMYLWGSKILFDQPKTGTVKILYIRQPKFIRGMEETSDVPEKYQNIPIDYVIARARQKDAEYGQYSFDMSQFYKNKMFMKDEIEKRDSASGIYMLTMTDYTGE